MKNNRRSDSRSVASAGNDEATENYDTAHRSGHYVDGPHRKSRHEFYATAPAYAKPYQNPWTARIVRSSRLPREEAKPKSRMATVVDRIMAVAVIHRFSPYKQETRRPLGAAGAAHGAWFQRLEHRAIVGTGVLVGLGLRPIDRVRQTLPRAKEYVSGVMAAQKDNTLVFTIFAVGAIGTIGMAGTYFATGSGYTPVDTISVQSEPPPVQPISQNETDDSSDDDSSASTGEAENVSTKQETDDCDGEEEATRRTQQGATSSPNSDTETNTTSSSSTDERRSTSSTNEDTSISPDSSDSETTTADGADSTDSSEAEDFSPPEPEPEPNILNTVSGEVEETVRIIPNLSGDSSF